MSSGDGTELSALKCIFDLVEILGRSFGEKLDKIVDKLDSINECLEEIRRNTN